MFILLGAAGLLLSVAWFALYRARQDTVHREPSPLTAGTQVPWTNLLRRRTVWGMMLGFGGINYTNWLYTAWVPGYLQIARHLSLARTGWIAAIPFLFGAAGMFSSGLLTDLLLQRSRLPLNTIHRACLVTGMILSAASTVVVARSSSTAVAVARYQHGSLLHPLRRHVRMGLRPVYRRAAPCCATLGAPELCRLHHRLRRAHPHRLPA